LLTSPSGRPPAGQNHAPARSRVSAETFCEATSRLAPLREKEESHHEDELGINDPFWPQGAPLSRREFEAPPEPDVAGGARGALRLAERISPRLASWMLYQMASHPPTRRVDPAAYEMLKTARRSSLRFNNHDVQIYMWGEAPGRRFCASTAGAGWPRK
jgi:hypothetical protein